MKNEGGTRSDDRRQTASEEGKRDGPLGLVHRLTLNG